MRPRILKEFSETFRNMQSVLNTSTQRDAHIAPSDTSVDSSIAAFATETTHAKGVGENLSSNSDKPSSPNASMQSSSVEDFDPSRDQRNAETVEQIDSYFLADTPKMESRIQKVLRELGRFRDSRTHNRPLLLDDLKELGMVGELSEDSKFVTMSFEDCQRLVYLQTKERYFKSLFKYFYFNNPRKIL